jgi:serine protease Do
MKRNRVAVYAIIGLLIAIVPWSGYAVADLQYRDHPHIRRAFRETVDAARKSTVRVLCDGKAKILGAIVDAEGFVVTKASELSGKLAVRTYDNQQFDAEIVGADNDHDLALLKLDVGKSKLPKAIQWRTGGAPVVGSLLATPGLSEFPLAIGVASAMPRPIRHQRGFLGVGLDTGDVGPRISEVIPESAAFAAGVQVGDVVTHVNGQRVGRPDVMVNLISRMRPGDRVKLSIKREDSEMEFKIRLGTPEMNGDRADRFTRMNTLGGELSTRRAGFPVALQHDTVLRPDQCGGPIVDLDGNAIGINIARAGRVNSLAVPADTVQQLIKKLKK